MQRMQISQKNPKFANDAKTTRNAKHDKKAKNADALKKSNGSKTRKFENCEKC